MSEMEVPEGWELENFPEVIFFQEGPGLRTHQFTKSGMKVVNITNLENDYLNLSKTDKHISLEEFDKKYKHFEIRDNEILMASSGSTFGKISWVCKKDLPLMMNTSVIRLHPKSHRILLKYIWYFLKSNYFLTQIKNMITGSAQPNFGPTHLAKSKIIFPTSIILQKKIVQKLDLLLDEFEVKKKEILSLIEQNKERINFFEKNWLSYVIDAEIEKHPQRNEWDVLQLENVADVIDPHPSHRAPPKETDGYPFAGIGDISEDGTINVEKARTIGEKFVIQQEKSYEINDMTIGYGRVASVGKVMRLRKQRFRYAISPTLAVINPNDKINHDFLFYILQSNFFFKQVLESTTGSTRMALGIMKLRKIMVVVPPIILQQKIVKKIQYLVEQYNLQKTSFKNIKQNYEIQIKYLKHIQPSVLDSAFTGKLVV